jgi:hypothetical protein
MFKGTETTTVTSSAPQEQVYSEIEKGLKDLGNVKVSKSGTISVEPAPNLSSFHSATAVTGQVTKEPSGDYLVKIEYDINPTPVSWILTVVLGCLLFPIGFAFFLISLLQKGTATTAIQNAFQNVKAKVK